ncbi:MAG: dUTP diphosphatase [Magnetococcales bacterium]|nr:dUTP diphosphatase [Magnetococcales bacterium]NGZ28378.1 dUTP diphosphatase [Magnetococcales bacterium]
MKDSVQEVEIAVCQLPHGQGMPLPAYQTASAAGMDLLAAVEQEVILQPGEWRLIPSGLTVAIPQGYEGQVRPRSGLAFKHGVTVLNAPGTIDADYRGEIGVLLINHGKLPYSIQRGDRIAQFLLSPVLQGRWQPVNELPVTQRGEQGFGHTGR